MDVKKTNALPGTSKPASTANLTAKKKRTKLEELSSAVEAEEITRQKELDLAKGKVESSARVKVESLRLQREALVAKVELNKNSRDDKSEKRQIGKELALKRMELKHALCLEKLHMCQFGNHTGVNRFDTGFHS